MSLLCLCIHHSFLSRYQYVKVYFFSRIEQLLWRETGFLVQIVQFKPWIGTKSRMFAIFLAINAFTLHVDFANCLGPLPGVSKLLKTAKNTFTCSDFTNFSKQASADPSSFRSVVSLHFQNVSNCCRHK